MERKDIVTWVSDPSLTGTEVTDHIVGRASPDIHITPDTIILRVRHLDLFRSLW